MRFDAAKAAPVPWKNGGGTTRELSVHQAGGRMAWRLSLADIGRDGPFSGFPGLMRIHTIVAGNGLRLSNDSTELQARPLQRLLRRSQCRRRRLRGARFLRRQGVRCLRRAK